MSSIKPHNMNNISFDFSNEMPKAVLSVRYGGRGAGKTFNTVKYFTMQDAKAIVEAVRATGAALIQKPTVEQNCGTK